MSELKEYNITEVCDTISETYRDSAENVVLINTSDVLEGKVTNHEFVPNKNLAGQFKKKFQKDDILYSEIRPANKRYAYVDFEPKDYIASTKLMVLRSKPCILPKYLYYLLTNNTTISNLHAIAVGRSGTFPQITYSELANIRFLLPSIEEQKEILSTLLSLDNKIAVNKKICENLETQAQALFKHWFVDFAPFKDGKFIESELGLIPEGWRVGTFGEVMSITSGKRPSKKENGTSEKFQIPLIGASDIMGYTNTYLYNEKILVIGRVGTHGIVQRFDYPCWPSDNTLVIKSSYYEFCYHVLRSIDYKSLNRGSTQPLISQSDINNYEILIPTNEILSEFEILISPLMESWKYQHKECSHLATLRDTLLPKLMSGQIKL